MKTLTQILLGAAFALYSLIALSWLAGAEPAVTARYLSYFGEPAHWMLGAGVALWLLGKRVQYHQIQLVSTVDGHNGGCVPTWLNRNQVDIRLSGGVSGFFKKAQRLGSTPFFWVSGPEFHGRIQDRAVHSTALSDA